MKIILTREDVHEILILWFYNKFCFDLKKGEKAVQVSASGAGAKVTLKLDVEDDE